MARAEFRAAFEPVYPCRRMPTRHCPAVYHAVCGSRPCARFEAVPSDIKEAWLAELAGMVPPDAPATWWWPAPADGQVVSDYPPIRLDADGQDA